MRKFAGARHFRIGASLLVLFSLSSPCCAGMVWSARAADPSQIDAMRNDQKLLDEALFGEPPELTTGRPKGQGQVNFSSKENRDELAAWVDKRQAEVGDTAVDLDKAWHGIHYLLTGSQVPDGTLASKVIWGGEDIGPDYGYGPARLLKPDDVKAIAKLLAGISPDQLRSRFKPKEMTRAGIYPDVIWDRDGDEALKYLLDNYTKLVAFYTLAAQRGQAVVW